MYSSKTNSLILLSVFSINVRTDHYLFKLQFVSLLSLSLSLSLCLRLTAIFPGETGPASFIEDNDNDFIKYCSRHRQ